MGILLSLLKAIFDIGFHDTPEEKGIKGERSTVKSLNRLKFDNGIILQNLYVPTHDGETTEIDAIYISSKGIFVIESKNYAGYIFGREKNSQWTVTFYAGKDFFGRKTVKKFKFYNPIWQNRTHIKYLKKYLHEDIDMFSVIVFSDECELKSIDVDSHDTFVCNRSALSKVLRNVRLRKSDVLDENKIEEICSKLALLSNVDEEQKIQHVARVRQKINNVEHCPRCGGRLVLRTAKKGANAGKRFYGCSNFPKCKFTKNI